MLKEGDLRRRAFLRLATIGVAATQFGVFGTARAQSDESKPDEESERRSNAGALFSFRGIAPTQNASLLDGVSGDQGFRGGARGAAPGGPRSQSTWQHSRGRNGTIGGNRVLFSRKEDPAWAFRWR